MQMVPTIVTGIVSKDESVKICEHAGVCLGDVWIG